MAVDDIQDPNERRKASEALIAEQVKLAEDLKNLQSEAREARSDFSKFRGAMVEMSRSIDRLGNPLLSTISVIGQSVATYHQQIKLHKQEIEVIKSKIAVAQQDIKVSQEKTAAAKDEYELASLSYDAVERKINAENDLITSLEERKQQIKDELAAIGPINKKQEAAAREKLEAQQSEIARLKDLAAKPISNAERGLIDPSIAGMTGAALKRHIESLESASKATESEVAKMSEVAKLKEELERVDKDKTNAGRRLVTAEEKLKSRLEEFTKAKQEYEKVSEEGAELEKEKNKNITKLNEALKKEEAELRIETWRQLANVSSTISTALSSFLETVRDTQNKLGISSSNAVDVIMGNFASSIESFFSATTVSTKEIMAQQEAFQEQFGGVLTSDAAEELAQQAKELGVTGQQLASARRVFMTQTSGDLTTANAQQDKFLATFRQQGLTNKDAMQAITQYSEIYARNGSRFADSFTKAAIAAKKIGVDLGKIDQIGDNIIGDFEGFLEKQAELGAMGFNFDSSKLAQVAESGDTGALMTELRSQLAAQGKDLQNLRRSEQLSLSSAFGIPMAELQRLATGKEGSGEEVDLQKEGISKLTWIADKLGVLSGIFSAVYGLLAGVQTALLSRIAINTSGGIAGAGGLASKIPGIGRFFGGGTPAEFGPKLPPGGLAGGGSIASTAAATAPTGGGDAAGPSSKLSDFVDKMDAKKMLAAGAALLLIAGALFISAKAFQEFADVEWESMAKAGIAILGLTGALALLGTLMMSGIGAAAIFAGIGALTLMAGAVYLVGKALQSVGDSSEGIASLGSSFDILTASLSKFNDLKVNGDNIKKIKSLAVPSLTQSIRGMAASIDTLFANEVAATTAAAPAAPVIDFSRLEAKLDQVVRAIGSMEVKLDATKVGEITVNNEKRVSTTGIFSSPRIFG